MIKKMLLLMSLLLVTVLISSGFDTVKAADKKGVVLSTVDLKQDQPYEILGLVYYRSSELNPKKIHDELRNQAEDLGADYVIGITYYNNAGYLYGSGTAVKLIKKDAPR